MYAHTIVAVFSRLLSKEDIDFYVERGYIVVLDYVHKKTYIAEW